MNGERWYHGGIRNLNPGDLLVPSPPHVTDGCLLCVARAEGRTVTVGEYRRWLMQFGDQALPVLKALAGEMDGAPMDPPSARDAVYLTASLEYATWHAARSGHGDVYEVDPIGEIRESAEDNFPTVTAPKARVLRVVRRRVFLTRPERRQLMRAWGKRDRLARAGNPS